MIRLLFQFKFEYYDLLEPKILKTPLKQITVPTTKIAQDKSDNQSASKAKRKKVPTTQITTPTKIVI
ncbi:hypothetical protein D3C85_1519000 [compost metagenome]